MPTLKNLAKSTLLSVKSTLKNSSEKAVNYTSGLSSKQHTVAATRDTCAAHDDVGEVCLKHFEHLVSLTSGNALLQPLGGVIATLDRQSISHDGEREPAVAALVHATEILAATSAPARHLEFALAARSNEADTQQLLGSIEGALAILLRPASSTSRPLTATQHQDVMMAWQRGVSEFFARCQEAWELHTLFVFLDVKGDQALLQQTGIQLCTKLRCSPTGLAACMIRTKQWVEETLAALGGAQHKVLLERLLWDALREWHENWLQQLVSVSDQCSSSFFDGDENYDKFWEGYFSHVQHISWPDFAEAFEAFFLFGRAPVDVLSKLREKLDKSKSYKISRADWHRLMKRSGTITQLVQTLMNEIGTDVSSLVFRPQPLPKIEPMRLSTAQAAQAISALKKTQELSFSASQVMDNSTDDRRPSLKGKHQSDSEQTASETSGSSQTPVERAEGLRPGPITGGQTTVSWDDFFAQKWADNRPFWAAPDEAPTREEIEREADLRMEAIRVVSSAVSYTKKALVLGVASGGLSENRPVIEMPAVSHKSGAKQQFPSLVVCANGTYFNGATRFGRQEPRSVLLPDYAMGEPIASRSHFSIMFDQETDSFNLMDAGSKWGTFMKLTDEHKLSCGDWIRVGNAELIIRYCGGGCESSKGHSHYKLHSLRLLRDHESARPPRVGLKSLEEQEHLGLPTAEDQCARSDDDEALPRLEDTLPLLLNSRRKPGWVSSSARLSLQGARQLAGVPSLGGDTATAEHRQEEQMVRGNIVPLIPLELDFISGGRMGEKLVLNSRISTLGRSEENTVQVSDAAFANVSRVHCIFEYKQGRWVIRDNASTNGTWRRTSCILEPSRLMPLRAKARVLAGVHEFSVVDEAQMTFWWAPSAGGSALHALFHESSQVAAKQRRVPSGKAHRSRSRSSPTTSFAEL